MSKFLQLMHLSVAVALLSCSPSQPEGAENKGGGGSDAPPATDGNGSPGSADGFSDRLCSASFCWQLPLPQGNDLFAIETRGSQEEQEVWAVGGGGAIVRKRAGVWRTASVATSATLRAVFPLSSDDVWAVGDGGVAVHYNGKELRLVPTGSSATLRGLWASGKNDVWAVGDGGTILHFENGAWAVESGGLDELHAIWGSAPNDIWAVGGTLNVGVWVHYDGTSWKAARTGLSGAGLYAVKGTSPTKVWAAGEYGKLFQFDGVSWTLAGVVDKSADRLLSLGILNGSVRVGDSKNVYAQRSGTFEKLPGPLAANGMTTSGDALFLAGAGGSIKTLAGTDKVEDELRSRQVVDMTVREKRTLVVSGTEGVLESFDGASWTEQGRQVVTSTLTTNGALVTLAKGATTNGKTALVVATQSGAGPRRELPPAFEPVSFVRSDFAVTASSEDDIFVTDSRSIFHWNGTAWASVPMTLEVCDQYGAVLSAQVMKIASDGRGSAWLSGAAPAYGACEYSSFANQVFLARVTRSGIGSRLTVSQRPGRIANASTLLSGTFKDPNSSIQSLSVVDERNAWAGGVIADIGQPYDCGGFVCYESRPFVLRWDGAAWKEQQLPGLAALSTVDRCGLVAAARDGTAFLALCNGADLPGNALRFDAKAWSAETIPASNVFGVGMDGTTIWVGTSGGLLRSR